MKATNAEAQAESEEAPVAKLTRSKARAANDPRERRRKRLAEKAAADEAAEAATAATESLKPLKTRLAMKPDVDVAEAEVATVETVQEATSETVVPESIARTGDLFEEAAEKKGD